MGVSAVSGSTTCARTLVPSAARISSSSYDVLGKERSAYTATSYSGAARMEKRRVITLGAIAGAIAIAMIAFGRAPKDASASRVPTDPNEVLETLPSGADDSR